MRVAVSVMGVLPCRSPTGCPPRRPRTPIHGCDAPPPPAGVRASRYVLARECHGRGRRAGGPQRDIRGPICTDSRGAWRTFVPRPAPLLRCPGAHGRSGSCSRRVRARVVAGGGGCGVAGRVAGGGGGGAEGLEGGLLLVTGGVERLGELGDPVAGGGVALVRAVALGLVGLLLRAGRGLLGLGVGQLLAAGLPLGGEPFPLGPFPLALGLVGGRDRGRGRARHRPDRLPGAGRGAAARTRPRRPCRPLHRPPSHPLRPGPRRARTRSTERSWSAAPPGPPRRRRGRPARRRGSRPPRARARRSPPRRGGRPGAPHRGPSRRRRGAAARTARATRRRRAPAGPGRGCGRARPARRAARCGGGRAGWRARRLSWGGAAGRVPGPGRGSPPPWRPRPGRRGRARTRRAAARTARPRSRRDPATRRPGSGHRVDLCFAAQYAA